MSGSPGLLSWTTSGRRLVPDWQPSGDRSCETQHRGRGFRSATDMYDRVALPSYSSHLKPRFHDSPRTRRHCPALVRPRRPISDGPVRRNLRISYGFSASEPSTAALVEFRCGDLRDSAGLNRGWQERAELGRPRFSRAADPRTTPQTEDSICGDLRDPADFMIGAPGSGSCIHAGLRRLLRVSHTGLRAFLVGNAHSAAPRKAPQSPAPPRAPSRASALPEGARARATASRALAARPSRESGYQPSRRSFTRHSGGPRGDACGSLRAARDRVLRPVKGSLEERGSRWGR